MSLPQDSPVQYWDPRILTPIKNGVTYRLPIRLTPSTTFKRGAAIAAPTATPGIYSLYTPGASDGTQNAEFLMPRDYTTDASGNLYFGQAASSEYGVSWDSLTVYAGGLFATSDLLAGTPGTTPGVLNAAGITAMGGKLIDNGAFLKF